MGEDEIKHIVRIAKTNLEGSATVESGLTAVKGIGIRTANVLAKKAGIDPGETLGRLAEDEIDALDESVEKMDQLLPEYIKNRCGDPETGEDIHLKGGKLEHQKRQDIEKMKKIRSYKGVRHSRGQKVRGQRTRSTGRTGSTVGVDRAKLRELKEEEEEEEE